MTKLAFVTQRLNFRYVTIPYNAKDNAILTVCLAYVSIC